MEGKDVIVLVGLVLIALTLLVVLQPRERTPQEEADELEKLLDSEGKLFFNKQLTANDILAMLPKEIAVFRWGDVVATKRTLGRSWDEQRLRRYIQDLRKRKVQNE